MNRQRSGQSRETRRSGIHKEVLAELVGKLKKKLDPKKPAATSIGEKPERGELRPNLDRLTVGVDLGDQWSNYCIGSGGGDAGGGTVAYDVIVKAMLHFLPFLRPSRRASVAGN